MGSLHKLTEFAREVYLDAEEKGLYDNNPKFQELIALCHCELSESLQEYVSGRPVEWHECTECLDAGNVCDPQDEFDCTNYPVRETCKYRNPKPEGYGPELADCILLILSICGSMGIDIGRMVQEKFEHNKTRPYQHGKGNF